MGIFGILKQLHSKRVIQVGIDLSIIELDQCIYLLIYHKLDSTYKQYLSMLE